MVSKKYNNDLLNIIELKVNLISILFKDKEKNRKNKKMFDFLIENKKSLNVINYSNFFINSEGSLYTLEKNEAYKYHNVIKRFTLNAKIKSTIKSIDFALFYEGYKNRKNIGASFFIIYSLLCDIERALEIKIKENHIENKDLILIDNMFLKSINKNKEIDLNKKDIKNKLLNIIINNRKIEENIQLSLKNKIRKIFIKSNEDLINQYSIFKDDYIQLFEYEIIVTLFISKNKELFNLNKAELEFFYEYLLSKMTQKRIELLISRARKIFIEYDLEVCSCLMVFFLLNRVPNKR